MTKEIIRNKDLTRLMKEYSDDYTMYEYEDFLRIFSAVIEDLVGKEETIRILNFGDFKPRYNKPKNIITVWGEKILTEGSLSLSFIPSRGLQQRLKDNYRKEVKK